MSAPVGVGVIGAGVISDAYLKNLTSFPDVRVLAVADLDVARAAERAELHGVPRSGGVAAVLGDPDVEIVVNLTIPAAHVEVGLAVLDAGKHVWTEKPLALDRESARKLLDRAQEKGLRVASAPDTVLGAGLQTARRAVDAGRIGEPRTALAIFQTPGPESWHPAPEFLFQAGGGPLLDMGPYYLTTLVQLFGAIRRVTATA
ncbi:MAG TPA: Gfo/Idh/MocA family oxidoreductase, partial [Umezawaea sp.]|nr:Gfo/Idh/MocA family oxidoreductase [Umezawaea sp.]